MKPLKLIPLLIIFAASLLYLYAEPLLKVITDPRKNINSIEMHNWGEYISEKSIFEWAASRGMELIQDAPPVINREAFFVHRYGSDIILKDVDPSLDYYLYIDFVRYSERTRDRFDSVLNIHLSPLKGDSGVFFEKNITQNQLKEDELFILEIPRKISTRGPFRMNFREKARIKGYWGIWDIILATEKNLPDRIDPDYPEIEINEKIF